MTNKIRCGRVIGTLVIFLVWVISSEDHRAAQNHNLFPQTQQDNSQSDWQQTALNEIKQRLVGRENEPAEKVFKNIEVLRGKNASRLPGMMAALTGLLGV